MRGEAGEAGEPGDSEKPLLLRTTKTPRAAAVDAWSPARSNAALSVLLTTSPPVLLLRRCAACVVLFLLFPAGSLPLLGCKWDAPCRRKRATLQACTYSTSAARVNTSEQLASCSSGPGRPSAAQNCSRGVAGCCSCCCCELSSAAGLPVMPSTWFQSWCRPPSPAAGCTTTEARVMQWLRQAVA